VRGDRADRQPSRSRPPGIRAADLAGGAAGDVVRNLATGASVTRLRVQAAAGSSRTPSSAGPLAFEAGGIPGGIGISLAPEGGGGIAGGFVIGLPGGVFEPGGMEAASSGSPLLIPPGPWVPASKAPPNPLRLSRPASAGLQVLSCDGFGAYCHRSSEPAGVE
jgi:hypothetical protein